MTSLGSIGLGIVGLFIPCCFVFSPPVMGKCHNRNAILILLFTYTIFSHTGVDFVPHELGIEWPTKVSDLLSG